MLWVLDTDTCVELLRHNPHVMARLRQHSPDDVTVTAVTVAELHYGALASRDAARSRRSVEAFLVPIRILPFDAAAVLHHAAIRLALRSKPMGERDLMIAAIVLDAGATLVTHNQREFRRIAGLPLESWVSEH